MKRILTKLAIVATVALFGNSFNASAQVIPGTTANINYVCSGGTIEFPAAPVNTKWIVRYSPTSTTTPGVQLTLTGNSVALTDIKTGFYYLINKGDAVGSCESTPQELAVYLLAPITASFTFANYCSENAAASPFAGTANAADPLVSTYAYQWYTVAAGVATAIPTATTANYTPTATNTTNADITTTYRLQVGYLIGGSKYCGTTIDHDVKVLAKPTTPTITIPSTAQTW